MKKNILIGITRHKIIIFVTRDCKVYIVEIFNFYKTTLNCTGLSRYLKTIKTLDKTCTPHPYFAALVFVYTLHLVSAYLLEMVINLLLSKTTNVVIARIIVFDCYR